MSAFDRALRATKLAQTFEGYAAARRSVKGIDPEQVHTLVVADKSSPVGEVEHQLLTAQLEEAAVLLRERAEGVTLADEQWDRLRRTLAMMPYSGAIGRTPDTIEGLVSYLEAISAVQAAAAAKTETTERQLNDLLRQREAARAWMGVTSGQAFIPLPGYDVHDVTS